MAGNFVVVSQNREVQVLGPTEVIDVEKVGIRTKPTGIYVEYPMPLRIWEGPIAGVPSEAAAELLGALAAGIEQQISEGLAVGGSYVQDFDANNLLVDYVELVVEYVPTDGRPPQRTSVLIPLEAFIGLGGDPFTFGLAGNPAEILSATYSRLQQIANS